MREKTKKKAGAGLEANSAIEAARKATVDLDTAMILKDAVSPPPAKTADELEMEALVAEFRGSNENLEQALGALLEVDAVLETLAEELKESKRAYDIAEKAIIEMMMDQGIPKFQAMGKSVTIRVTEHATVLKEHREEQYRWMRKEGYGDLIVETVFPSTFSKFVRDVFIEPGNTEALPEFVRIYKDEKLYIRKAGAAATANESKVKEVK